MEFSELATSTALWFNLYKQYKNGYHMSDNDIRELVRLNYVVMEAVHNVHNEDMSKNPFDKNR